MSSNIDKLWTVVLAAGGSTRLGRPKQLLRIGQRPLILRALDAAHGLTPNRVVVVVGADRLRVRTVVRRARGITHVVANARWRHGMASSLRLGLDALPKHAMAALLLTCDQPLLDVRRLQRLVSRWAPLPQRAVAARYDARVGVPAILPRHLWAIARRTSGDVGAREILRSSAASVVSVRLPEAAIDIDTDADLAHLDRRG